MRELSKSMSSFSWAMSLFGIQQTANLLSPAKAAKAFDCVTEAAAGQFGDTVKTAFGAGDKLQRGALDLTLGLFTGENSNPGRWTRMASDAVRQSVEVVTKGVQETTSTLRRAASTTSPQSASASPGPASDTASVSAHSQRQGWGSMPS